MTTEASNRALHNDRRVPAGMDGECHPFNYELTVDSTDPTSRLTGQWAMWRVRVEDDGSLIGSIHTVQGWIALASPPGAFAHRPFADRETRARVRFKRDEDGRASIAILVGTDRWKEVAAGPLRGTLAFVS